MELRKGMLAISKAGHDHKHWYVVLDVEGEYAFLINGKTKTLENPKTSFLPL